ncbi:MAG: DUF1467 family protein [Maritimibacter sp.]
MSITSIGVVFIITWFLTMFIILPIEMRSQADEGEIVPGTHAGAPADFKLGRTMLKVTLWAIPISAAICAVVISGLVTVDDLDFRKIINERVPN